VPFDGLYHPAEVTMSSPPEFKLICTTTEEDGMEKRLVNGIENIGPIQMLAVAFGPEADYEGKVIEELDRLEGGGLIRVLDLLFVGWNEESDQLVAFDYQGDDLGGLVGIILGFPFDDVEVPPTVLERPEGERFGVSRAQMEAVLAGSKPDDAVAVLLLEHVWAKDLKNAIRSTGGLPIAEGFLSVELLSLIGTELEATVRLLDEMESQDTTPVGVR
jgi:hypothetical protein